MQFSPPSCHFIRLWSKYPPQHHVWVYLCKSNGGTFPWVVFAPCLSGPNIVIFSFCWVQRQDEPSATPVRRTPVRPEIAATPSRPLITPSKRSQSDTSTTTPLRWGTQQRTRSQQNVVVETSDQLSVAAASPAVNLNPTSPLAVGEHRNSRCHLLFYTSSYEKVYAYSHIRILYIQNLLCNLANS
jgi:hypothetical protein